VENIGEENPFFKQRGKVFAHLLGGKKTGAYTGINFTGGGIFPPLKRGGKALIF